MPAKKTAKKSIKKSTKQPVNKGGRPRIELTAEQKKQVEKLAPYLTQEQLADFFGISKTTFYEITNRDEEVSELYKRGRMKLIAGVAQSLYREALDGNVTAMIFIMKTQAGWKETITNELKSDGLTIVLKK